MRLDSGPETGDRESEQDSHSENVMKSPRTLPPPASPPRPLVDSTATAGPRQARSRETEQRIVIAALQLLGERTFEQMTVAEIATSAGVSVGGFYARFAGKDALLEHLNGTLIGGMVDRASDTLSREATSGLAVHALVERFVSMVVDVFRSNRPLLRQITARTRTSADPAFLQRVSETNRVVHDLFRERLSERLDDIGHARPSLAIDIALTAVSGALREYVLFDDRRPHFDPVDDDTLVVQLTDLFCRYLRVNA